METLSSAADAGAAWAARTGLDATTLRYAFHMLGCHSRRKRARQDPLSVR